MISIFWIVAPVLVAIAIAVLAIPLWRRTQPVSTDDGVDALGVLRDQRRELDREVAAGRMTDAERDSRIAELSRRVIDEGLTASTTERKAQPVPRRGLAIAIAVAVPLLALPMYLIVGTPAALDPAQREAVATASPHGEVNSERFRMMLGDLKMRLDAKPDDADGWRMLAGGLRMIEDLEGSVDAYARAGALRPGDAKLLVDYADVLALTKNRDLSGKPFELVKQALAIDPQLPKALAMAGAAEWSKGRKAEAKMYWQRMLAVIPADSEDAGSLRRMLAEIDGGERAPTGAQGSATQPPAGAAMAQAGAPAAPTTAQGGALASATAGKAIPGTVRIAPEFAREIAPGDTLYVLARPAQGPRMPLAVIRRKASELPFQFSLDDSLAMPGGAPLSSAAQVRIEARISKSGDAIAKTGDLRGESEIVAPGASNLSIVIDQLVR
jgi:cytochrome c-type biogenesis protein CcmH